MTTKKRVMVVYGTRPEAIKVAPVISRLAASDDFEVIPAVTGQHREMLDQVNELFGIVPVHDFDLMVPGATLDELAARSLTATTQCIRAEKPDAVLSQGDTTTAFISSLAAFYAGAKVVHLEAGLRSGDITNPFPEEANRQLTARLANLHLAPTTAARDNLVAEGIAPGSIAVTGNTVIDALQDALTKPFDLTEDHPIAEAINQSGPLILVTAHRRESWGAPMREAMQGVRQLALARPEVRWLIPMHRNPVVREVMNDVLGDLATVTLTEPLDYHAMSFAMQSAHLILTDSGGVQEEAPSLGKPVLVMRENTERPEAVTAGTVRLIGTQTASVVEAVGQLLDSPSTYEAMTRAINPYGDGHAAERSVAAVAALFGLGERLPDFVPGADSR